MDTTAVAEPTEAVESMPVMQVDEEEVEVKKGYEDETREPEYVAEQQEATNEQSDEDDEEEDEDDTDAEGKDSAEA